MGTVVRVDNQDRQTSSSELALRAPLDASSCTPGRITEVPQPPLPDETALRRVAPTAEKAELAACGLRQMVERLVTAVGTPGGRGAAEILGLLDRSLRSGAAELPLTHVYGPTPECHATRVEFGDSHLKGPFLLLRSYTGAAAQGSRFMTKTEAAEISDLRESASDHTAAPAPSGSELSPSLGTDAERLTSFTAIQVRFDGPQHFLDLQGREFDVVLYHRPEPDGTTLSVKAHTDTAIVTRRYAPAADAPHETVALGAPDSPGAVPEQQGGTGSAMLQPVAPSDRLPALAATFEHVHRLPVRPRSEVALDAPTPKQLLVEAQRDRIASTDLSVIEPFERGLDLRTYLPARGSDPGHTPERQELACAQFQRLVSTVLSELPTPSGTAAAELLRVLDLALAVGVAELPMGAVYGPTPNLCAAGVEFGSADRIGSAAHFDVRHYTGPVPKGKRVARPEELADVEQSEQNTEADQARTAAGNGALLRANETEESPRTTSFTVVGLRLPMPVECFHVSGKSFNIVLYHSPEPDGSTLEVQAVTAEGIVTHRYAPLPPESRAQSVAGAIEGVPNMDVPDMEPGRETTNSSHLLVAPLDHQQRFGVPQLSPMVRIFELFVPHRSRTSGPLTGGITKTTPNR